MQAASAPHAAGAYGVQNSHDRPASELDSLLETLRFRGFAVAPSVLDAETVARLNAGVDRAYERQCQEVGGEANLARINDADIARCLLAYDPDAMALATHPLMMAVARAMLGESIVLLMQNGVINRPDRRQFQTNWHRDLNYQHWVCTRPLAVSALVCLEDFTVETGGTVFLPGSHKVEQMPSFELIEREEVTPAAPAGSILFMDSMIFHRAGFNRSSRIRRAINHVIGAPILAQQVDIPAMLKAPPPADPWLAGYLGYRWNPVPDVAAWRRRKLDQAGG
jgi:ectoine hydroxylase-related dioxygenase (phytanoyl-CoA dioxygenase family)